MVWCGAKSGYPKGTMCLEEIGWFARNMITTMSSMVNLIGGDLYDHPMSMKMFHFENEEDVCRSFENHEKWLIVCFMS